MATSRGGVAGAAILALVFTVMYGLIRFHDIHIIQPRGNLPPAMAQVCPALPDDMPCSATHEAAYLYSLSLTGTLCDVRAQANITKMADSLYKIPLVGVTENKFTIVMLTRNRDKYLMRCLENYCKMKRVAKILVYWNNPGRPWPNLTGLPTYAPVELHEFPPGNKLRLRFHANPTIHTQGVFVVDDDLLIPEYSLYRAFNKWKKIPWSMVGFTERGFRQNKNNRYVYGGNTPSMILTNAAFLHLEYLRMYEDTLPPLVASTIDNFTNCEDISMNMMVAKHCGCAHAHRVGSAGVNHMSIGHGGLWTLPGHDAERSACINIFAEAFSPMPLIPSKCAS